MIGKREAEELQTKRYSLVTDIVVVDVVVLVAMIIEKAFSVMAEIYLNEERKNDQHQI
jgi:hypothetical protein